MSDAKRFVILGAGPAGLGAAYWLARRGFDVEVLERNEHVGGNAGSFDLAGIRVDFGSHRLHPSTHPELMELIQGLLGEDLLTRPRHGRIRLSGRWIHFPLKLADLVKNAPPSFAAGVAFDLAKQVIPSGGPSPDDTFASVLRRGLGRTICQEFYFPYARKMWGEEPEALSPIQAYKRVSAGSIQKMLKRLKPSASADGKPGAPKSFFYYPKRGFGQISEALRDAAVEAGARISMDTNVEGLKRRADGGWDVTVSTGRSGGGSTSAAGAERRTLPADSVWSTIPAPILVRLMDPAPPAEVITAATSLALRAMVLAYVVLDQDQYTEFDAHYFPGTDIPFTRLSEPKNYSALGKPQGRTVLCAEIPCSRKDAVWSMSDDELAQVVVDGLKAAGLPAPKGILEAHSRRLPQAYPIYHNGYEVHFEKLDGYLEGVDRLLSFGRQGLFAHDNTHHTLSMARAAVNSLDDAGVMDHAAWERHRKEFEAHVVED